GRAGPPILGPARYRAVHDLPERGWEVRAPLSERSAPPQDVGARDLAEAASLDRIRPAHQVIEQDAYTVDIAGHGSWAARQDLRRHVMRSSGDARGIPGYQPMQILAGSKVHEDDSAGPIA